MYLACDNTLYGCYTFCCCVTLTISAVTLKLVNSSSQGWLENTFVKFVWASKAKQLTQSDMTKYYMFKIESKTRCRR